MKPVAFLVTLAISLAVLLSQTSEKGTIVLNSHDLKWESENGAPPGADSATLREDPKTGAIELIAHYPAGHVFKPHWHTANERILLLEGRLSLQQGSATTYLDPGGYAFLPAREVQKMACVSTSRCSFYVYWDGKLDFNKAGAR